MVVTPRALMVLSILAALVVFSVVQDRMTAQGARQYVRLQRQALASGGPLVTVDEVVSPAVDRSVRQGLLWGGAVLIAGLGLSVVVRKRRE